MTDFDFKTEDRYGCKTMICSASITSSEAPCLLVNSHDGGAYVSLKEARRLNEYLTKWIESQPEPFPFEDGDILVCEYLEGFLYTVRDRMIFYRNDRVFDQNPKAYVKVGRLD